MDVQTTGSLREQLDTWLRAHYSQPSPDRRHHPSLLGAGSAIAGSPYALAHALRHQHTNFAAEGRRVRLDLMLAAVLREPERTLDDQWAKYYDYSGRSAAQRAFRQAYGISAGTVRRAVYEGRDGSLATSTLLDIAQHLRPRLLGPSSTAALDELDAP